MEPQLQFGLAFFFRGSRSLTPVGVLDVDD
jgi:hypothetical protein